MASASGDSTGSTNVPNSRHNMPSTESRDRSNSRSAAASAASPLVQIISSRATAGIPTGFVDSPVGIRRRASRNPNRRMRTKPAAPPPPDAYRDPNAPKPQPPRPPGLSASPPSTCGLIQDSRTRPVAQSVRAGPSHQGGDLRRQNEREGGQTRPSFIDAVGLELNEVLYPGIGRRGEDLLLFLSQGSFQVSPFPR